MTVPPTDDARRIVPRDPGGVRGDRTGVASVDPSTLLSALPVGILVVDADGRLVDMNQMAVELLGGPPEQVLGRSVLELIHPDDIGFAADVMSSGPSYDGQVTGPMRFRYLDLRGRVHGTLVWSRPCLDRPGIDGFVLVVTEEATVNMLPEATRATALGSPLNDVVTLVTDAFQGHPCRARAAVMVAGRMGVRVVGTWAGADLVPDRLDAGPWTDALATGRAVDVEWADLPEPHRSAAAAHDVSAVWCRRVPIAAEHGAAVLIVWRSRPGPPSPNQVRSLDDAIDVLALAFSQQDYRNSLERVAFVDPVSGVGNRARFEQLLDESEHASSLGGRSANVGSVLYLDLDGFKSVNDEHGHEVGDQILALVAARLRRALRSDDELVRVGGDEFVVLCGPQTDVSSASALAARVGEVLAQPFAVEGHEPIRVGASIGVESGGIGMTLRRRVSLADLAMLDVKRTDKGGWRLVGSQPDGRDGPSIAPRSDPT